MHCKQRVECIVLTQYTCEDKMWTYRCSVRRTRHLLWANGAVSLTWSAVWLH